MSGKLKLKGHLKHLARWPLYLSVLLIALNFLVYVINIKAGVVVTMGIVLYLGTAIGLLFYHRPLMFNDLIAFASQYEFLEKRVLEELALPYAVMDMQGRMIWSNKVFAEITGRDQFYRKNVSTIFPDITADKLPVGSEKEITEISTQFGERIYRVSMQKVFLGESVAPSKLLMEISDDSSLIAMYLYDETELRNYIQANEDNKLVVALAYLDNYEEALESVEDVRRSLLIALIDRKITKYFSNYDGLVRKLEKDKYLLVMNRKGLDQLEDDRFTVLEDVKTVNIGNSIAATVSIGIGLNNGGYAQNFEAARVAMEMALARGGDQTVVKDKDKMAFFGGKTQHSEKNTRVRARVKAQALREMIAAREQVIVMGHKNTDIDSLGACVGVCRAAMQADKPAYIVLGELNSSIRAWVSMLKEKDESYAKVFITHEQAIEMTNQNTVVVVVDTNRPSITECEEILYLTRTIVVLDHHRQTTEKIENASLSYIEPSASSACEMISEILQYYDAGIKLKPYEADTIYAGIIIDTNNFVAKTGMRTFEAAAFLRRYGADVTRVRKAFRNDMETYKARAEAVRHAEAFMGCYAISVCPSEGLESPNVVGAQAANELLNIIGVKASFVLTDYNGKIFISARSIDEVNVQIIMERLGGGGHMNIAGAQLTGTDLDGARQKLKEVLTQMTKEGAI